MAAKKATSAVKTGPLPPYGVAIKEAIASGDLRSMKAASKAAKKHIADVEKALKALEAKIAKLGG
jgi:hypothetical protein